MSLAPICLFTYNRFYEIKQTIKALQKNYLAKESDIIIFSDGSKNSYDRENVKQVREYLKTISGFKSITIFESSKNKGLANSVIDGVSQVINQYGKVIVLEDDLICSNNFLQYMNTALDYYSNEKKVNNISGFSFSEVESEFDTYFLPRGCSWGWATWENRWTEIDWEIDIKQIRKTQLKLLGDDFPSLFRKYLLNSIDSWAIPWNLSQLLKQELTVYPVMSKVANTGFNEEATHTFGMTSRFKTILDTTGKKSFNFDPVPKVILEFKKQFDVHFNNTTRIKYLFIRLINDTF